MDFAYFLTENCNFKCPLTKIKKTEHTLQLAIYSHLSTPSTSKQPTAYDLKLKVEIPLLSIEL